MFLCGKQPEMQKVELGFKGERFLYIPTPEIEQLEANPLTNDLYIYSMGHFSHAAHHYIDRPEGCDEELLIYCKGGCGHIRLYGHEFELRENQFIILPKGIPHAYWADDKHPWTIYWIHFRGKKAGFLSDDFHQPTTIPSNDLSRIEERLDMFEEIYFVLNESLSAEHLMYANLCFGHFIASLVYIKVFRTDFRHKEYSENKIRRAIHYMNENIEGNLSLRDFASFCGYSNSYFYRKFVKETGYPPMEYYMRLKMEKACKMLEHTDMKICQIAHKLGFSEVQYFSRAFSRVMGTSAMAYRNRK